MNNEPTQPSPLSNKLIALPHSNLDYERREVPYLNSVLSVQGQPVRQVTTSRELNKYI